MDTQTQPVTFLGSQQVHCFIPIRYQVGYNPLITFVVLATKFSNLIQKKKIRLRQVPGYLAICLIETLVLTWFNFWPKWESHAVWKCQTGRQWYHHVIWWVCIISCIKDIQVPFDKDKLVSGSMEMIISRGPYWAMRDTWAWGNMGCKRFIFIQNNLLSPVRETVLEPVE